MFKGSAFAASTRFPSEQGRKPQDCIPQNVQHIAQNTVLVLVTSNSSAFRIDTAVQTVFWDINDD